MTSDRIRKKFVDFFKKNGHILVPSSSLWPQDDPSVLLTTAGMQQFKPYFMGEKDPLKDFGSKRLVSVQRCFRTSDIEEVGDASHCTFFEMLGNFSVGNYFKKEAIDLAWQFLVKEVHVDKDKLWSTYFAGDNTVSKDAEAQKLWQKYLPAERIIGFGRQDNWWGPPGTSGPCGPSSEIHYDFTGKSCVKGAKCLPNCDCGRFMELWNLVFTEYHQSEKKIYKELPIKNIDTGMGLERLAFVLQSRKNIFATDLFEHILSTIKQDINFGTINDFEDTVRSRIAADHLKGTVFLLADGITFSNKEQGYILRRIFRRGLDQFLHQEFNLNPIIEAIINTYRHEYVHLSEQKNAILEKINTELVAYKKIISVDITEAVEKIISLREKKLATLGDDKKPSGRKLLAKEAFTLYTTYGLSPERLRREGFVFDQKEFDMEIEKHQHLSRGGAQKKFGGHGLTSNEWSAAERQKMTRLHTATHLLHQALRIVLGNHVKQQGSDIDPERLRFDFDHPQKISDEEKKKIENLVNEKIKEDLPVQTQELSYQDALGSGALAFFKEKYPPVVSIYSIGNFSKEVCGGPHVKHTGEIGHFKIISEKSSSAGIRRIKATVEP